MNFIDYAAKKNCYATLWSYGEICVGCRCCDKNTKIRRKARLSFWKWWLDHNLNFNEWFDGPKIKEIQKVNVAHEIIEARKKIRYYSM